MGISSSVLVCVTPQESSKKLVEAGRKIAENSYAELEVITVLPPDFNTKSNNPVIIDSLHRWAKDNCGKMAVYYSDEPIMTIAAHIGKTKPESIVVGFPGENSNDFISIIRMLFPLLPISMIDGEKIYNLLPFEAMPKR